MSDMIIRKIDQNIFVIDGIAQLSGRQAMKFNIFINGLQNVKVSRKENEVNLSYCINEKILVAKSIRTIVEHFAKNGIDVKKDEGVIQYLSDLYSEEEERINTLSRLAEIQKGTFEASNDYKLFCEYCNEILQIQLRDYQYKAAYLLSLGKGGFDFSVPGAGKTIITYSAYGYLKNQRLIDQIFVTGPASSYNAWVDEYITCFGAQPDFENLADDSTKECKIYLTASARNHKEITFINVEKLRLLVGEISSYISKKNTLLIVDEAHKIKNPEAAITKAILEITKYAKFRIILTGTPMPNGYEDLYSLSKTFSPFEDILPYRYNQLKRMTKNEASPKEAEMLRKSIEPYYSRISKKYLIETKELLPPKFHFVACKMNQDQEILYNRLNTFSGKMSDDIDGDILEALKKAISIRKMQVSANPALLKKSLISSMDELRNEYADGVEKAGSKIDGLIKADREIMSQFNESSIVRIINKFANGLEETSKNIKAVEITKSLVESGEKVLIWDVFVKNMEVLKVMLETKIGVRVEMINGLVSGEDRQSAIRNFREGSSMILVANPATLAESISLHKVCQNAIYVNRNFNAAQFIQSKDRIHRINMPQGTTASYYILLNEESIDSCVDSRLIQKENRMLAILDADDIEIGGEEMEDTSIMSKQDIEESYLR